jgi:hypothetical protein
MILITGWRGTHSFSAPPTERTVPTRAGVAACNGRRRCRLMGKGSRARYGMRGFVSPR